MNSPTIRTTVAVLALMGSASAASIVVDASQVHQTIEGFGGQHIKQHKLREGPFYIDAPMDNTYDSIVYDLGVTVHRHFISEGVYPDAAGQPLKDIGAHVDVMRELLKRGVNKFIPAVLSPPAWMKTNDSYVQGGALKTSMYGEFARVCAEYCKLMKRDVGIYPYAFSIQNELAFVEPYGSCVYTPEQFRQVLKVVGEKFVAEGIPTRMYGPECMGTYTRGDGVRNYMAPLRDDRTTAAYLKSLAVHSYKDGIAIDYGSAPGWSSIRTEAALFGIPVWMTETGGYAKDDSWLSALKLGMSIHIALKHGDLTLWSYLDIANASGGSSGGGSALMLDGAPRNIYWVAKHFYRYVRAGAQRIEASSDDADLLVTAYRHSDENTYSVVIINQDSAAASVAVSGAGLPAQFSRYESTSSRKCGLVGTVSPGQGFTVPGNSITTLYSGAPSSTGVVLQPVRREHATAGSVSGMSVFRLDGRMFPEPPRLGTTRRMAHGTYCVYTGRLNAPAGSFLLFKPTQR
jgi:O-glycosyl hydrolase